MKGLRLFTIFFSILICSQNYFSQTKIEDKKQSIKATPAYAELLLRKVELESDVESFLESYTEDHPKVKNAKYELSLTNKDLAKLLIQTDASKLSLALGKLLVRKNQVETEFWALQNQYSKDHPEVKRAQRKALSFQNAVKEIMP